MKKIDYESIEKAAAVLKVISHPVRLRIVETLRHKELNVSALVKKTGAGQSAVSQHLKSLKLNGVLGRRRNGNIVYYFVSNKNVLKIIDCISGCSSK